MYGAKAAAISKIARDTFMVQPSADQAENTATEKAIQQSIFDINDNNDIELSALTEIPKELKNETYIRLVIALANCPLVQ